MAGLKRVDLVFIPSPGMGHLVSAVEIATVLADRDNRLSITLLIMSLPFDPKSTSYIHSLPASLTARIRFVNLPPDDSFSQMTSSSPANFFTRFIDHHKPQVRDAVAKLTDSDSFHLAGFVVDMFCTPMIDIAHQFGVPSYVFFTSGAGFLGLLFHLQDLHDHHNQDLTEFKDSDAELAVPCFVNPLPARVLPFTVLDKEGGGSAFFINQARRFRETKGIMVNTFVELDSYALSSFLDDPKIPKVYPVGPMLDLNGDPQRGSTENGSSSQILSWLDDQPPLSVVFFCFGSRGSFGASQVREIACGLERSGHRFLWSLRKPPPPTGTMAAPSDYSNPEEVLPEGFLDRTAGIGRVIGWAPQVAVLSHPAIGGFVSHCGWNSTLESLWCGVPIATWPIYAEQQMNAFRLVRELGLAVEITLDYKKEPNKEASVIVGAADVERGIRSVMEHDSEVRAKVKDMKENGRKAVLEGGSSYSSIGSFIEDVIQNIK